jgi:predicted transcriptional regulator
LTIMAEILDVARKGTVKTQIMCRADLSFTQLKEYISFLREVRLLKVNTENGKTIYTRTPKAVKYLETFAQIKSLLRKSGRQDPMIAHAPYWPKPEE